MSYEVEQSEAPRIIQADVRYFLRFKPKDGVYTVYDREMKENKEVKTIDIIKISDSRFTVKAAQNEVGAFIFSGLYRDARNTITVLEKRDGRTSVIAEGDWQTIKQNSNLKYVKVLYCLYKNGKTWHKAQFDLMGIASIQWQKVSGDGVLTLAVSDKKSFQTPRGDFYEITKKAVGEVDEATDGQARVFAGELANVYDSYDANAQYYAKSKKEEESVNSAVPQPPTEMKELKVEETEDEIRIDDVPF